MKRPYKKLLSVLLTAALLNLCWLTSYGWAEMAGTQESSPSITREMLIEALNRNEVQKQLDSYGISKVEAVTRINSLTDEEISELAAQIKPLRAGGGNPFSNAGSGEELIFMLLLLPVFLIGLLVYCLLGGCGDQAGAINSGPIEEACDPGMESCSGSENVSYGTFEGFEDTETICSNQCRSRFSECTMSRGLTNKSKPVCTEEKQMCHHACLEPKANMEETYPPRGETICEPGLESCT